MAAEEILPKRRAVAQMSQVVHGQRLMAQNVLQAAARFSIEQAGR
jgi:hypothetical protein